jgi:hypothetical protein
MVGRQSGLTALFSRHNAARQRVEPPVEEEDRALELIVSDEEAGEEEIEGVSDDGRDEGCEVWGATADGGGGGGEDGGGCVGGARKKTLREFMAPRQAEQQGVIPRAASNLCRALMSSETGGRMSPAAQVPPSFNLPTFPTSTLLSTVDALHFHSHGLTAPQAGSVFGGSVGHWKHEEQPVTRLPSHCFA